MDDKKKYPKLGMYAVYDLKGEVFDVPFFAKNDLFAGRKFIMDIRSRRQTMIASFKEDFHLVKIGEYDAETAEIEKMQVLIVKGSEVENEISNDA